MSKKANPKAIGGFVVGAVLLILIGVAIFGTGRFFVQTHRYVMFFEGRVQGLQVGAPVLLRGVTIGQVAEVRAIYNPDTTAITIPVIIEINEDSVGEEDGVGDGDPDADIMALIERGMRAQLVQRSFVTGQQAISLDFHPDTEVKLVETTLPYMQIPTIPSSFEKIETAFAEAPELMRSGTELLKRATTIFSDQNIKAIDNILANLADMTGNLNQASGKVEQLVDNIDTTITEIGVTAREAQATVKGLNEDRKVLREELIKAGQSVTTLADNVNGLVQETRKALKDFTSTGLYEISNLATDSQAAMEQFRRVMEEMERNPARFFLGQSGTVRAQ